MLVGLKEVIEEGKKRNIAVGNFNTPLGESLSPRFSSVDLNVNMLVEGVITSLSEDVYTAPIYIPPKLIKRY